MTQPTLSCFGMSCSASIMSKLDGRCQEIHHRCPWCHSMGLIIARNAKPMKHLRFATLGLNMDPLVEGPLARVLGTRRHGCLWHCSDDGENISRSEPPRGELIYTNTTLNAQDVKRWSQDADGAKGSTLMLPVPVSNDVESLDQHLLGLTTRQA